VRHSFVTRPKLYTIQHVLEKERVFTYRIRSLKFSLAFQLSSYATLVTTPDATHVSELLSGKITRYPKRTPLYARCTQKQSRQRTVKAGADAGRKCSLLSQFRKELAL
jgi:hypothetical protein